MESTTLVCTSLNPDDALLKKMLASAKVFDDVKLYIIPPSEYLSIPDAYNLLIEQSNTEWICCFCDDDYFYEDGLREMLTEVHKGIDADVAHFKFRVSGYTPPEDVRCWFGRNEYDLYENKRITPQLLEKHNRLPAGSFFRKSAWSKAGGFQGDKFHDWDLWKRMSKAKCSFKYFDHLVYNFVRRENSAWIRQNGK